MKKAPIALLFLLTTAASQAQVAVSSEAANVLYAGFDNPITVAVSDVPDSNLVLVPSVGRVLRDGRAGRYLWRIDTFTKVQPTLVLRDTVHGETIDTFWFRVRRFPDPRLSVLANTRGSLLASNGVAAYFEFGACGTVPLVSYEVVVVKKSTHEGRLYRNEGSRFNPHVVTAFEQLQPGDTVIFQNATCRMPGDTTPRRLDQVIERVLK